MEWRTLQQRNSRWDPRVLATWLGAVVVLGCGVWLQRQGGGPEVGLRARPDAAMSGPIAREMAWFDQRLADERAAGAATDPRRACRVASLHWERAERRAQHEYYRRFGMSWMDGEEEEFAVFSQKHLRRDPSGDVAAALAAARRGLQLTPAGPERVRGLWLLSLACGAAGRHEEEVGALVEAARYKSRQSWIWRRLAQAFRTYGDAGRFELAEEQAWRIGTGRPLSPYIATAIAHTPYACPAPRPLPRGVIPPDG